jgi:hypothetical protein
MRLKVWSRALIPALLCLAPLMSPAQVSVNISVGVPPPALPVYEQPPIPDDGYIWTPGYWAWGEDVQDYYWVPGTWVEAPQPGFLWTPSYWGWAGGAYLFHAGYWGPHVGFYGGVNYGYGYGGNGFDGGYWQGGHLYYNRSVTNISNVHVTNVYNKTVINNVTVNRVSYNGGTGGVRAEPTAEQQAAAREQHLAPVASQQRQVEAARGNQELRAKANNGHPPIAATARPGVFSGAGVVAAKQGGAGPNVNPAAPRPPQSDNRAQDHTAVRENRPENPEPHAPRHDVQPPHPPAQPAPRPPVNQQPRPPQTFQNDQHRDAPQNQAPRPNAAPPPRAEPRAEPHPAERAAPPAAHDDNHDHH